MNQIVWADNPLDYTLAAMAHRKLRASCGEKACYPILGTASDAAQMHDILRAYGLDMVSFASLVAGEDPLQRSRYLEQHLDWNGSKPLRVRADAQGPALLAALMRSFREDAPILFGEKTDDEAAPAQEATPEPHADRLIVTTRASAVALPAALYANATNRRLVVLDSLDDMEQRLGPLRAVSAMIADERETFTKHMLRRLLAWSQDHASGPAQFAILSGRSPQQVSAIVARLMIHRDFHDDGHRLAEPPDPDPIPACAMTPMEYYVIGAHGNEMHLDHRGDEVLCGAANADARADPECGSSVPEFDCRIHCPHDNRLRARDIPAHAVLLLSCDAFTLADGLAPPQFNLLLSFLDGMAATVLAPFKHVQFNEGFILLANALLKAGFTIGEIAKRLNDRARAGSLPDYAYLVLGDPELTLTAQPRAPTGDAHITARPGGITVEFPSTGATAIEITLPLRHISAPGDPIPPLAVEPLSETLRNPDVFYTLSARLESDELTLILFTRHALAEGPLRLRIEQAERLEDADHDAILRRLDKASLIPELGLENDDARQAKSSILSFLRSAAGFPRAVELAMGQSMVRNIDAVVAADFTALRRASLIALLDELRHARLWISQRYAHVYPRVSRAGPQDDGNCPHCGEHTTCWRYEDTCTHFPPRRLMVCDRCGIISDGPADAGVEIRLATIGRLSSPTQEQSFVLNNRARAPVTIGYCLQLNAWRTLDVQAEGNFGEARLEPGEEISKSAVFRFPDPFPDDVVSMQFFAMTDAMDLYFLSQKMRAAVRATDQNAHRGGQTP